MYIRSLDSLEVRPLQGSEGISNLSPPPFWSDDSRYVVYMAQGWLKKSEVNGTPAQTIAEVGFGAVQGGAWSQDGTILYGGVNRGIQRIPPGGGAPTSATAFLAGETAHRFPQFLPDGRRFLYLRVSGSSDKTGVYIGSLDVAPDKQDTTMLLPTNRQAWWVMSQATGAAFLLMQRDETLLAQPFDLDTAKLSGTPVLVASGVGSFTNATSGLWSVARYGALTYRAGGAGLLQLTWRDFSGRVIGTIGDPGLFGLEGSVSSTGPVVIAPDQTRVAYRMADAQGNLNIYVRDLARNIATKLTFSPEVEDAPVWSSDSKRVMFAAVRNGLRDL